MDSSTLSISVWGTDRVPKAPLKPGRTPLPDSPPQRPEGTPTPELESSANEPATAEELDVKVPEPKGLKFWWKDNEHNDTKKAVVNQKDESKFILTLTDETGKDWQFPFAHAKNFDWSDKNSIARLNNQRGQVISRRLDRPGAHKEKGRPKALWTTKEKDFLSKLVHKKIRKNKRVLSTADWMDIGKAFNAEFEGKEMAIGERISPGVYGKKGSEKNVEVKVLTHPHVIHARQSETIRTQFGRWPDEVQKKEALLASVGVEGDAAAVTDHEDDESEQESESEGVSG